MTVGRFLAYRITCHVNGKCYIGITTRGLKRRWGGHVDAASCGRKTKLAAAIRKHGAENFSIEAIAEAVCRDDLLEIERILVGQYDSMRRGYNMTVGGDGVAGLERSAETRAKLAAAARGRTQSPETIAKRMEKLRGRKYPNRPQEWCNAIAAKARGRRHRPGQTEKIRAKMKGRVFTPEWRAKISAAKKGRAPSEATRAAQMAAVRGCKRPERTAEHRAKLAENARRQWARVRAEAEADGRVVKTLERVSG